MNLADMKTALAAIVDEQIEAGGTWKPTVIRQFIAQHPHVYDEFGPELVDSLIAKCADDAIRARGRADNAQEVIPGIREWDLTVTVVDAEGNYGRRRLADATESDLVFDLEEHVRNTDSAIAARDRAKSRNSTLLPVMQAHRFRTAGEAIEFLRSSQ